MPQIPPRWLTEADTPTPTFLEESESEKMFPGLKPGIIVVLALLVILPHYLNDIYIVYLNKAFVTWAQVDGRWIVADLAIGKWVIWLLDLIVYLSLPVLALFLFWKRGWLPWRCFDLKTTNLVWNFLFGIVLFVCLWCVMFYIAVTFHPWLDKLLPRYGYSPFFYKREDGWLPFILVSVYLGLAAGFLEEFVYRSFLIRTFERIGLETENAGVVALVLFTLIHASQGAATMVTALVVGGVFTVIYLRQRNILPLIVAHSSIDVFWVSGYDEALFLYLKPFFAHG